MERAEELKKQIEYYSNKYYNESISEISDFEFDKLTDELKLLGGYVEIGAPSYGQKIMHRSIMGSLEKDTSIDAIINWAKKYTEGNILITPKIDGLSCRLNYENGILIEAVTRGDGIRGQSVLDNVMQIKSIAKVLPSKVTAEFRGEILMRKSVFNKFLEEGVEDLANPRNAASGSLMAKDPKITGDRNLSFLCWDVITGKMFDTELDKFTWIHNIIPEIETVLFLLIDVNNFEDIVKRWEMNRLTLDYQIDGLVIALNNIADQEAAGWSGHRPKGKIAFKFKPEQGIPTIKSIDRQVGRTGRLTPVAYVTPIILAGTTVQKVTLYNESQFLAKDIAIGDKVLMQKAGDVIPELIRVIERSANRITSPTPTTCPICSGKVVWDERHVSIWCINDACPARFAESVLHYITTLEIMDVGEGIVYKLCDSGAVKTLYDLYDITKEQIKQLTGGDRSAEKTYNAIHEKKNVPLNVFLDSLGISGLGTKISKDIAKEFKTLEAVRNAGKGDFIFMDGIQALTEAKIIDGLANMSFTIDKLLERIKVIPMTETTGSLSGKSFCLTGAMSKPRKEIEKAIETAGGEIKSVQKGLTYLVQADPTSTSSKTVTATKYGVSIISEEALWKMIEGK